MCTFYKAGGTAVLRKFFKLPVFSYIFIKKTFFDNNLRIRGSAALRKSTTG